MYNLIQKWPLSDEYWRNFLKFLICFSNLTMNNLWLRVKQNSSEASNEMEPVRVCGTGKPSQTEGCLSVKEECVKSDSARLEKGKVYHGNKELYMLIWKAVSEEEGRISPQTIWKWKNGPREISKSQESSWAWLLRNISKRVDLANVSSIVVIEVNEKDNMNGKETIWPGEWDEIYRALFLSKFKLCYWICYPFCINWKMVEINDCLSYLFSFLVSWKYYKSQKIQI